MKYHEEKYSKFGKYRNLEGFKDLYEILQLDSAAISAYEVLGNEERRRNYDETSGTISPIKSNAVSLTISNYERLVEDSNDLWIIQVYEDGNDYCQYISGQWENVVKDFRGTVRFGRINFLTQKEALKKLPINILIVPTIIAVSNFKDLEIYTIQPDALYYSLKRFVEKSISDHLKYLNYGHFQEFLDRNKKESENYNVEIMRFNNANKPPADYKYNCFKILKYYGNTDADISIFYTDFLSKKRTAIDFTLNKKEKNQFEKILNFAKFLTIPQISRTNYFEFCENVHIRDEDMDESDSQLQKESLCVFLIEQDDKKMQKNILEKAEEFISSHTSEIIRKIKNKESAFEDLLSFQFGWVNLNYHRKFKNMINRLLTNKKNQMDKNYKVNEIIAIALHAETKKIALFDNIVNLEDWLLDLLDSRERIHYNYLNEVLEGKELYSLFYSAHYNIIKNGFIKGLIFHAIAMTLLSLFMFLQDLEYI